MLIFPPGVTTVDVEGLRMDQAHLREELRVCQQKLEETRRSMETYRQIVEKANDAIYLFELNHFGVPGKILEVNDAACRQLGYTREEYLSMDPSQMDAPESNVDIPASMDRLRQTGSETIELVHLAKDGTPIPVEVSSHLFQVDGHTLHLALVRDIRERKAAEAELRRSLAEKETLLREIHHRVKNNLQVVSSLVNLKSSTIPAFDATDIQNRIRAMSLVHEILYGRGALAAVRFDAYITSLAEELFDIYGKPNVRLEQELEAVEVETDRAVSLGILVNELLTNALKHAFPGERPGSVHIAVRKLAEARELVISDDGVGLPESTPEDTLGLVLVDNLVEQINASLSVTRDGGTTYTITF